jgi:serine/threonine protein kinase
MYSDDDKTRTYVPLTNGTMVSHYRIIEKIGAGGMSEVHPAEDTSLNRHAAIRVHPFQSRSYGMRGVGDIKSRMNK